MTDDCSECSRHFADNGDLSADTERQSAMGERDIPGKTYRTHSFDKHTAGKDCEALSVRFPGLLDSFDSSVVEFDMLRLNHIHNSELAMNSRPVQ